MTIIPGRTTAADQIEIRNRVFQQNQEKTPDPFSDSFSDLPERRFRSPPPPSHDQ